jgi:hypothetical protein
MTAQMVPAAGPLFKLRRKEESRRRHRTDVDSQSADELVVVDDQRQGRCPSPTLPKEMPTNDGYEATAEGWQYFACAAVRSGGIHTGWRRVRQPQMTRRPVSAVISLTGERLTSRPL